jgi:hypothetical protein
MQSKKIGIFEYIDPLADRQLEMLPDFLLLTNASHETIILRLLSGHIQVQKDSKNKYDNRKNYFFLPYDKPPKLTYSSIKENINNFVNYSELSFDLEKDKDYLKKYLNFNRKNTDVYNLVLFELSYFLCSQEHSPTTAFSHLYRCLEYLSYSFPLVYASKSKDYKGSFNNLKKFLTGDTSGELKFFRQFLNTLFSDEESTLNYTFEIDILITSSLEALKKDLAQAYSNIQYDFEDSVLKITFRDILDLFVTTRNSYFHMLVGQGSKNFSSIDYDIDEYFRCINDSLLNWLSMIIGKVSLFGFSALLPSL